MSYFDGCYFDPAYFEADPCVPSTGGKRWFYPSPAPDWFPRRPPEEDDEEFLRILLLL